MTTPRGTHTSPSDGSYENVSPGAVLDAPIGLLEDPSPPEEEIDFTAAQGSPPPGEGPDDDDDDDDDDFSQDDTSRASSTFSLPEAGVDPAAMVNLSDPERVCLVSMGRRFKGKIVPCVCGRSFPGCTRRSHAAKRETGGPSQMGEPGVYVRLAEPAAPERADGRLDMGWHSPEGWLAIQERAQEEREEVARHLGQTMEEATGDEPPRGDPTVAFGGVTYHGGSPSSRTDAWTVPNAPTRVPVLETVHSP